MTVIKQNKALLISEDALKAWPFWSYGYYGADGTDWRQHATNHGFKAIPDFSEEATPLTFDQARAWNLMITADPATPGDWSQCRITTYEPMTVYAVLCWLEKTYAYERFMFRFNGIEKDYDRIKDAPEPLLSLQCKNAVMYRDDENNLRATVSAIA